MKITAEPRSDQWNADDFIGGPRTFTIAGVKSGTAEQKYDIELVEGQGRSWRPPLTVLRLLIAAWGDEAANWTDKRVTLYRDETVSFGPDAVGGIRVSSMSDLPTGNKPFTVKLTTKRGRRASFSVDPLPAAPPPLPPITDDDAVDFARAISEAGSVDELNKVGGELKSRDLGAHRSSLQAAWTARNNELKGTGA